MTDFSRREPPTPTLAESMKALADAWSTMAKHANDLAHARRTLFLAYVAEGFNETQALELVKTI